MEQEDVVRCRRVEIVDHEGRVRIVLGMSTGDDSAVAEVAVYGRDGSLAVLLGDGSAGNGFVGLSSGDEDDGDVWISGRRNANLPWSVDPQSSRTPPT